jgi:pimeloyl-ACP methyl ester carboxylesterase
MTQSSIRVAASNLSYKRDYKPLIKFLVTTFPTLSSQLSAPFNWPWRGHQICYTVEGSGRPIVLIHGFGASIGHWRKNIPALVEGGYRVFALDLLGFGASDKPQLDYTLELWEEMVADFWAAHIQEPAIWVGNSIGGLLALMVLAHHPAIASGGVLLNCAGGLNHRPDELNPPLRFIMGTFTRLVSSSLVGPFLFNRIRQRQQLRSTLKQVYCDHNAVTDELVELIYQPSCDPGAQKVFASILTAPPGPKPCELLPDIQQPLLILWGEADPWTPISGATLYQELAHDQPQRVMFQAIADAGHCPHDERPEDVNRLILNWLEKLD